MVVLFYSFCGDVARLWGGFGEECVFCFGVEVFYFCVEPHRRVPGHMPSLYWIAAQWAAYLCFWGVLKSIKGVLY